MLDCYEHSARTSRCCLFWWVDVAARRQTQDLQTWWESRPSFSWYPWFCPVSALSHRYTASPYTLMVLHAVYLWENGFSFLTLTSVCPCSSQFHRHRSHLTDILREEQISGIAGEALVMIQEPFGSSTLVYHNVTLITEATNAWLETRALRADCMNATQQLSLLISPIWVDSTQKSLYETQNSTQVDLSLLKTWVANFSAQTPLN